MMRFTLIILFTLAQIANASPGRCRKSDVLFHSEEGGCLHFKSGKTWSRRKASDTGWAAAAAHCRALDEGGFKDWRLPSPEDLEALASQRKVADYFAFSLQAFFWTDAVSVDGAWTVLAAADEERAFQKLDEKFGVWCVRKPFDRDGDFVPDSSDECSRTPRGSKVATTGPRKGCAAEDQALRLPYPGADPCDGFEEPKCRKSRGCGWGPRVKKCFDITTSDCPRYPEEWWCRATAGCAWISDRCQFVKD